MSKSNIEITTFKSKGTILKGQHAKHCIGCGRVIRHYNQSGYCGFCREILTAVKVKEIDDEKESSKSSKGSRVKRKMATVTKRKK